MKRYILIILLLIVHCSYAQTQADMNKAAYAQYQQADEELNAVYKKILTEYKADTAFLNNLKASQRIWILFRDAELAMKYPEREAGYYGSIHPVCRAGYLEELTRERTGELRKWLDGAAEGDACSGSVKIKE